jgi:hypothetical protein
MQDGKISKVAHKVVATSVSKGAPKMAKSCSDKDQIPGTDNEMDHSDLIHYAYVDSVN